MEKFTKGKENLDKLLGMQRMSLDKGGIGLESKSKNLSQVTKLSTMSYRTCHYCCNVGHMIQKCPFKQGVSSHYKWIPKTNTQGPKQIWVPKSSLTFVVGTSGTSKGKEKVK